MAKATKEKILAAALEMFSQNGYAGTNIRELTASLGMVKSSIYKHFASKEEIWDDLLDAMILLEKAGKTRAPESSSYSTQYEDQKQYVSVTERIEKGKKAEGESAGKKIREILGKIWHVLSRNFLAICREGETIVKIPLWVALIVLFASWFTVLVLVVVSLFFGCRYRFVGEADMQAANDSMDKAANAADRANEDFKK